ncbi:hypothetical protein GCM10009087_14510 [Sphingomonas oligophenolica]
MRCPGARDRQDARRDVDADDAAGWSYPIDQLQKRFACTAPDVQHRLAARWSQGIHGDQAKRRHLQIDELGQLSPRLISRILHCGGRRHTSGLRGKWSKRNVSLCRCGMIVSGRSFGTSGRSSYRSRTVGAGIGFRELPKPPEPKVAG